MSLEHSPARGANGSVAIDPRDFNLWEPTYSVKETIRILNDCRTGVYQLIAEGELHPIKRGRRTIFLAGDLAAYLARLQAKSLVLSKSPRPTRAIPAQRTPLPPAQPDSQEQPMTKQRTHLPLTRKTKAPRAPPAASSPSP